MALLLKIHKQRLSEFFQKNGGVLWIICLWFVFISPYVFTGKVPFPSRQLVSFFPPWSAYHGMPVKNNAMPDIITQIFPWRSLVADSLVRGVPALWNPFSFSGTVHAANYQSAAFFPLNLLFLVFSKQTTWTLLVLLQPLLAGLFMFLFLRKLKRSQQASVFGSISFMFCGFMTVWMGYATLGYSVLVTPLVLLLIYKWYEASSWWIGLLLSFLIAFSFSSGHFQMSLYVLLISLFYSVYLYFCTRSVKKYIGSLFFLVTGLLLILPQLVISYDAYQISNRSENFIQKAGIPIQYLATLFVPDFFGNPVTRNDWFGQYAEWASFIGVVPLFFSVIGIARIRKSKEWFFFGLLVVCLLFATESPFSRLLYAAKLPVVSTSVATRLIVFVSFSLSFFAAFGLDEFYGYFSERKLNKILYSFGLFFAFFILLFLFIFFTKPFSEDSIRIAQRNMILPIFFLVIAGVMMTFIKFTQRFYIPFIFLLLIIASFDMLRYSSKWMPVDEVEFMYSELPVIRFLKNTTSYNRVFGNVGNELNTYFQIPSIEGYDAMYQARYAELISAAGDGEVLPLERSVVKIDRQGKYTKKLLDLLGVKFILYRKSDEQNIWTFPFWNYEGMTSKYSDDHYEVIENEKAYPRAFFVSSFIKANNDKEVLEHVLLKDTNLLSTVVLEETPDVLPEEGRSNLEIALYDPERVLIRVDTDVPKLLFLSDVLDAGWNVLIDGIPGRIYRANYAFRAVEVPSGLHTVDFYYAPNREKRAVSVSLFTAFVLLIVSVRKLASYARRFI